MGLAQQFESLMRSADECGLRVLVAGGMAVMAHGYARMTKDIDLIPDQRDPPRLVRWLQMLEAAGYRPRVPVPLIAYADQQLRAQWHAEEDMLVFSIRTDDQTMSEVDLFLEAPAPFEQLWRDRLVCDLGDGLSASFVGLPALVRMKRDADRPRDQEDLRQLAAIHGRLPES
jgi:hypothetical protein